MEYFLALLMTYYVCDEAAKVAPLPPVAVIQCGLIYEEMKGHFLPLVEMPVGEANALAYVRFKNFERDDPELIAAMRKIARQCITPLAESEQRACPDVF
jgi:hypothetical protein